MPITDDLRKYAESAVGQGRSQLIKAGSTVHLATDRLASLIEAAPRPSSAAVGAADVAIELISRRAEAATRRVEHLPVDYSRARSATRTRISKRQEDALVAIAKAQEEALARVAALRARIPAQRPASADANPAPDRPRRSPDLSKLDPALRGAATSSLDWARQVLAAVNERGESRLQAGTDPRLSRLMIELDQAADSVQGRARPILEAFSARVDAILGQLVGDTADSAYPAAEPAVSEPAVSEPAVSEPAVSEPAVSEPAVSEQAVSEQQVVSPDYGGLDDEPAVVVELVKPKRKKPSVDPAVQVEAGIAPVDGDIAATIRRRPARKRESPVDEA